MSTQKKTESRTRSHACSMMQCSTLGCPNKVDTKTGRFCKECRTNRNKSKTSKATQKQMLLTLIARIEKKRCGK